MNSFKLYKLKTKLKIIFGNLGIPQRIRQKAVFSVVSRLSPRGKLILDAGCGNGAYTLHLAYRYPSSQFIGIDSDNNRVEQAEADQKILCIKNVTFITTDLVNPIDKREYDIIYCIDVLEHIKNDELVIRSLSSSLKLGGKMLIHVLLLYQKRHFKYFKNWKQDDHVRDGYNEQHLIEMLESHNLRILMKRYTFGWTGSLAWEASEICQSFSNILRIFAFPFLILLATINPKQESKGNAILIVVKKVN